MMTLGEPGTIVVLTVAVPVIAPCEHPIVITAGRLYLTFTDTPTFVALQLEVSMPVVVPVSVPVVPLTTATDRSTLLPPLVMLP